MTVNTDSEGAVCGLSPVLHMLLLPLALSHLLTVISSYDLFKTFQCRRSVCCH
jgi:hypothetical protein